jgi:hypothetical protein
MSATKNERWFLAACVFIAAMMGCTDTYQETDGESDLPAADGDTDTAADSDTEKAADTEIEMPAGCEGPIQFAHPDLESAVRAAINKPSGDILFEDVKPLTALTAQGLNINSVGGVQCLAALTYLNLDANVIGDISELSSLPRLTELHLRAQGYSQCFGDTDGCSITGGACFFTNVLTDISRLADMPSLKNLDLSYNPLTDISALSGLTSLTSLNLSADGLSDITALSGLTSLTSLNLSLNRLSNIEALSGLTSLTSLDLSNSFDCEDEQILSDIDALKIRGGIVLTDCF